jgi:hypothetical protein
VPLVFEMFLSKLPTYLSVAITILGLSSRYTFRATRDRALRPWICAIFENSNCRKLSVTYREGRRIPPHNS